MVTKAVIFLCCLAVVSEASPDTSRDSPDCRKTINVIQKARPHYSYHQLPEPLNCPINTTTHCVLTYTVQAEWVRKLASLCIINDYSLTARTDGDSVTFASSEKEVKITHDKPLSDANFCAPRGEDLHVIYKGNHICPFGVFHRLAGYIDIYWKLDYENIDLFRDWMRTSSLSSENLVSLRCCDVFMKLHSNVDCHLSSDSRNSWNKRGTIVSFKDNESGQKVNFCEAHLYKPSQTGINFCYKIVEVLDPSDDSISISIGKRIDVYTSSNAMFYLNKEVCTSLLGISKVNIRILYASARRNRGHLYVVKYFFEGNDDEGYDYHEDDDDDDDDFDLYWLFAIPAFAILIYFVHRCFKNRLDDDTDPQTSPQSDHSPATDRLALSPLQQGEFHGSRDGDLARPSPQSSREFAAHHVHPQPSCPMLDNHLVQPPSNAEPPSYFSLFPDVK